MSSQLLNELLNASFETLYMVIAGALLSFVIGAPLGALLFQLKSLSKKHVVYGVINFLVSFARSIPFIILLVLLIPVTRALVGTSIGTTAAIVPLTLSAIPFIAKLIENAFSDLPNSQVEMGLSLGAPPFKIIRHILLPDALPAVINALTVTTIALVAYSAMAGTVGGGGLGDLAIRYGYQRFQLDVLIYTVIILVVMVQGIQKLGDVAFKKVSH